MSKEQWPEWVEPNPIHLKTIIDGFGLALLKSVEWGKPYEIDVFLNAFTKVLQNEFLENEIPELTLQFIWERLNSPTPLKFPNADQINFDTIKYIRDDIRDAKKFEEWFKDRYKKLVKYDK